MQSDLIITAAAVLSACILLIVLAVQMQIKALNKKVDQVIAKLSE